MKISKHTTNVRQGQTWYLCQRQQRQYCVLLFSWNTLDHSPEYMHNHKYPSPCLHHHTQHFWYKRRKSYILLKLEKINFIDSIYFQTSSTLLIKLTKTLLDYILLTTIYFAYMLLTTVHYTYMQYYRNTNTYRSMLFGSLHFWFPFLRCLIDDLPFKNKKIEIIYWIVISFVIFTQHYSIKSQLLE